MSGYSSKSRPWSSDIEDDGVANEDLDEEQKIWICFVYSSHVLVVLLAEQGGAIAWESWTVSFIVGATGCCTAIAH